MLLIRADLVDEMVAHARRDHPREACGQLLGPDVAGPPERYVPMTNADDPDARGSDYRFDSGEQIRVYREALERGDEGEPIVVFHSHTRVPRRPVTDTGLPEAYPSVKDVEFMAQQPQAAFVIVALTGPDAPHDLRSFRLDAAGEIVEDEVRIVERYMLAHTGADDVPDRA